MQVYAIDEKHLLSASKAEKGKNYYCPECRGIVRLRRGIERHPHFFHPQLNVSCRLSQKGIIHLHLQNFIKNLLDKGEMEKWFPQIRRIADVADLENKIIFEIQYSPMSLDEAKNRCKDYESLGLQIIWILHDHTFNQKKITQTEKFLRTKTCYFSNMNEEGNGIIYDQLEEFRGKQRLFASEPAPINLKELKPLPKAKWPEKLAQRAQTWPLYCEGDLIDLGLKGKFSSSIKPRKNKWYNKLKENYLTLLHMLLERSSK